MLFKLDSQVQVAGLSPSSARFSQSCKTNALSLANSFGNFHGVCLKFSRCSAAKGNLPGGTMQCLFKRHKNIRLDILTVHRRFLEIVAREIPACLRRARPKELFEKVAESRAAEVKLDAALLKTARKSLVTPPPPGGG